MGVGLLLMRMETSTKGSETTGQWRGEGGSFEQRETFTSEITKTMSRMVGGSYTTGGQRLTEESGTTGSSKMARNMVLGLNTMPTSRRSTKGPWSVGRQMARGLFGIMMEMCTKESSKKG